ncbi:hypothetical protein ES702_05313 [subsurface metagenome]
MGKYTFPVKWHRFTTEEFDRRKAEYNAKYGYSIYIPGFYDIVKMEIVSPPTEEELAKYRPDRPGELSPFRWEQIKAHKKKKRDSFLRMMASPTPTWARNIGTAMTFLDDINDTMGTVAVIARFAMKMFPKVFGKVLAGPAGWALLIADICNVAMTLSRLPLRAVTIKTRMHRGLELNPFSKKAALARAKKLRRHGISKGELIEALQVTDNVMGAGLCLGPIVGLVQDIIFGMYQVRRGRKVTIRTPILPTTPYEAVSQWAQKAIMQLWTGGQELSDEDHALCIVTANASQHAIWPYIQQWNPLDELSDISAIEIRAPRPKDPTTLELFRQEGIDPYKHIGFLHLDKEYASPIELMDVCEPLIQNSWIEYRERNKHTQLGHMVSQAFVEVVQNNYALCEGEDAVVTDFTPTVKALHKMFDHGWRLAEQYDPNAFTCMADKVTEWDETHRDYTWEQMRYLLMNICHVAFTKTVPQ